MKKLLLSILMVFSSIISANATGHTVSATYTNVTCFGLCNGSAIASVSGGVGPFTYSWSSGGTSATVTGLCAGNDTVYCTDNSDMSVAMTIITIAQPPLLTVGSATSFICTGACATLVTTVTGGTPAYTFSWSGGLFGPSPTTCPVSTTTYTVTVTDANACVATGTRTVTVNPLPVVTVNSLTICAGGTATLTAGGASMYVWSPGGTTTATINVTPLVTTTYTVTGSTTSGCTASAVSTVTVNPLPTITLPSSYNVCSGACVSISASSSIPGSTYVWIGPSSFVSTVASPTVCPAISGTYTVTVTSPAGCVANATTTVLVDGPITSGITSTNATGCIICDGTASAAPIGGTSPYVYLWNDPGNQTTATATALCAGAYSVTITDMAGCTTTDSTTIFSNNDVLANFTMVPDSTNAFNFFCFNSSSGTGNSYAWDFGDLTNSTAASPSHTFAAIGTYTVCLMSSNFLCGADTLCQPVTVTGVLASCLALFNIADDTLNPDPNAHYVYNLSYGATLTYLWDFGDGTTSTSMTPSHVYAGTGPYLLCLSVNNGAGCTDMFCDSLISADSLNRSSGTMQFVVYDVPPFQGLTTGMADQANRNTISVSPNPFNEITTFEIKSNKTEIYSFELTDVLGKKVKSKEGISEKQFEVSRDGLQNGIYFYKIFTSESLIGIGKVVIK